VSDQPIIDPTPDGPDGDPRTEDTSLATDPSEPGFLPTGPSRLQSESVLVRVIATLGIVGIGTAIAAVLAAFGVAGWIIGLVVALVCVVLAAVLWRSRRL
jgi:hypothetical protein